MIIFSGNSHPALSHAISQQFNIPLGKAEISQFADQESKIEIYEIEKIKDKTVLLLQSLSAPANHHLMELLLMANTIKIAGPKKIIAFIPYFGYGRQELAPRLIADLLAAAKIDEVITIDVHDKKILEYFSIPIHHITHADIFLETIQQNFDINPIIISPDLGSIQRATKLAKALKNADLIIMEKTRKIIGKNKVIVKPIKSLSFKGKIKNRNCIVVDDIIDSGNTICAIAHFLKKQGAKIIKAYVTHAVLSAGALEKIHKSCIDELIVADTLTMGLKSEMKTLQNILIQIKKNGCQV